MRIGLIAGPWVPVPPVTYGGTERVVDSLARGFSEAGHEVLLAATSDSTCPVPHVPGLRPADPADMGQASSELSHLIKAYAGLTDVDVIHDHTLTGPLYSHRPQNIPVVTTIHGRLLPEVANIYRAMGADTSIVAISHDQVSHAPDVPVTTIIHHGMELAGVPVGKGEGGYAAFVGRMSPDKGITEAIDVARKAGIPLRITAKIREAEEHTYFKEVVQPLLGSNEDFIGEELRDFEKFELVGGAVAFLNPIQWPEPFGLVMIEALATGTPVVGTPAGAAPEIVDHGITGYLGTIDELPAFLGKARDLNRAACRAAVEERFTAQRMVQDHLRLFEEITGTG